MSLTRRALLGGALALAALYRAPALEVEKDDEPPPYSIPEFINEHAGAQDLGQLDHSLDAHAYVLRWWSQQAIYTP